MYNLAYNTSYIIYEEQTAVVKHVLNKTVKRMNDKK